jgi:hypothetical protein
MAPRTTRPRSTKRRSAQQVATILRQAFVHCLRVTRASNEQAARELDVRRYTVQRYLSGKSDVSVKVVLRSVKLSAPFCRCLWALERKTRKAA